MVSRRSKSFALIKALIPKLKPVERKELVVLINAGEDATAVSNASAETCALYSVMQLHLHKIHGRKQMPFHMLSPRVAGKLRRLQENLDGHLRRFMQGTGDRITRALKIKFYMLYCEVTAEAIVKNPDVPLSLNTLVNWEDRFLGLLDDSYPGYLVAGMLPLVLRALQRR